MGCGDIGLGLGGVGWRVGHREGRGCVVCERKKGCMVWGVM
jgi:hypothetical protein